MTRRRSSAHHACDLCRQRKRKCDGDGTNPCKSCYEAGADCVYLATTRVSKADLREALARLQSINSDNSALLDAISSRNTSPAELNNIVQRLSDGQSRAEVAEMLTQRSDSRDATNKGGSSVSLCTPLSPVSPGTILPSTQDSSRSSIPSDATSPRVISTPVARFRANLDHYRSQIPQLLDTILARDCLSFCPISKEDFNRDFESGSGQHCSTALLDALLALATLLVREGVAAIVAPRPEGNPQENLGDSFAREAIAALYNRSELPQRMADIQALGILALYCLDCGKMEDGLGFAGDFCASIAEQWGTKQSESTCAHRQAHANIYCAAVSFNRSLFLIQNYNETLDELAVKVGMERPHLHDDSSSTKSTSSKANLSCSITDDPFVRRDLRLLPNSPKLITAKLFEFTEWVYRAQVNPEKSFEQAVKVYQHGLHWYVSFFACPGSCSNNTPLMMFAHTYYHFGVMCLLTPYVLESIVIDSDGNTPVKVCTDAAGQIGRLIRNYSQLHGQFLDFMRFFRAAALACMEICKAKVPM